MDHLNISEVIGDGINPDEDRVVAHWAAGSTETPIRIATGPYAGQLKPNTDTVVPASVAQVLVDSGYDVEVKYLAIVNPEVDGFVDEALAAAFDAEAVVTGTVAEVKAKLAGLTAEQLAAVQAAETDREQPRKGVADAVTEALAQLVS